MCDDAMPLVGDGCMWFLISETVSVGGCHHPHESHLESLTISNNVKTPETNYLKITIINRDWWWEV